MSTSLSGYVITLVLLCLQASFYVYKHFTLLLISDKKNEIIHTFHLSPIIITHPICCYIIFFIRSIYYQYFLIYLWVFFIRSMYKNNHSWAKPVVIDKQKFNFFHVSIYLKNYIWNAISLNIFFLSTFSILWLFKLSSFLKWESFFKTLSFENNIYFF